MGELIYFRRDAINRGCFKEMSSPAKVITITSGKGGVGKTHTTVNLGYQLAKSGKRVLLLDADLGLANINIMLGFEPKATIAQVLDGKAKIKDVIVSRSIGSSKQSLDILPAASGIQEVVNLNESQRMLLLSEIGKLSENYDYVLVDTAAGIGDSVVYFNTAAEEIVVIIAPEPTSITDAYALIKVLSSHHGLKEFSILVNRNPIGEDGRKTYAKLAMATDKFLHVRLKYVGAISEDETVSASVRAQKPFCELYPSAKASRDVAKISEKIINDKTRRPPQGGLQFFFNELIQNS